MVDYKKLIEAMKSTAVECGKIILSANAENLKTKTKSGIRDLVTDYDVKVQGYAVDKLKNAFPQAAFFCEENGKSDDLSGELVFIIDPIDGTSNFIHGFHHSCVSIGCMSASEPIAGVVFDPYNNELFSAYESGGAYLNGNKVNVTDAPLESTLVLFGTSPYNTALRDITLEKLKSVYTRCLDLRRSGSAALDLCYVACGRAGLYFEGVVSLWDYAAGAVILKEAGGEAFDFGKKALLFTQDKTSVIAGSQLTLMQADLFD